MKPLPIIALLLSAVALAVALLKSPSGTTTLTEAKLNQEIFQLQRQVRQLQSLKSPSSVEDSSEDASTSPSDQPTANLGTSPAELDALKKSLDPYGVIQVTEDRIETARAKLFDTELEPWERARHAELLKEYGLFDDEAVAAMREILNTAEEPQDAAAALVALKGYVTPDMRDEILRVVTAANEGEKPNPRVTYHGIEALESLLPDPVVQNWMLQVAETNPEIKVATRAATSIGAKIQPEAPPADRRP